jgi:hypothetical protein
VIAVPQLDPPRWVSYVCGGVVLAAAVAVLAGWHGELPVVGRILARGPASRPVTGACLLALSLALVVARLSKTGRLGVAGGWLWSATTLGALALAAALLAQLFLRQASGTRPASPHTVASMALMALAIGLSFGESSPRRRVSIVFALAGAAIPWLAVLGYVSGITVFYALPGDPRVGMSIVSAVSLVLLCVGVMGLWPEHGFIALLSADSEGGMLLRVLLPAALLLPIALGGALHYGEQAGWLGQVAGPSINLGITGVVFIGLVLWIGLLVKRHEAEAQAAAAERERLLAELQVSLAELNALQKNLVTVCAWTRRVLDQGKWVRFEEFLEKHLQINVSHSISADALQQELKSLEDEQAWAEGKTHIKSDSGLRPVTK